MQLLITTFFLLTLWGDCFADTVLVRKSDGIPIEWQTGNPSLEVLLANNPQYTIDEVERKEMTAAESKALFDEKIVKPEKVKREAEAKPKIKAIKDKLGLTDEDIQNLKEVLK